MSTGEVMYLLLVLAGFSSFSASVFYAMTRTKDAPGKH